MPSQNPSVPQPALALSAHWSSGSCPAGTLVQTPALSPMPQERQRPLQAVMQQVPWAQMPELQSVSAPQLAPIGFLPQLPFRQVAPVAQSLSAVQVVLH